LSDEEPDQCQQPEESAGARWTGLRFINFDGSPIDRRERAIRFAAACLSFFSAGLGVLWSLADEEGLTWHDHMSKTFPTPDFRHAMCRLREIFWKMQLTRGNG